MVFYTVESVNSKTAQLQKSSIFTFVYELSSSDYIINRPIVGVRVTHNIVCIVC